MAVDVQHFSRFFFPLQQHTRSSNCHHFCRSLVSPLEPSVGEFSIISSVIFAIWLLEAPQSPPSTRTVPHMTCCVTCKCQKKCLHRSFVKYVDLPKKTPHSSVKTFLQHVVILELMCFDFCIFSSQFQFLQFQS